MAVPEVASPWIFVAGNVGMDRDGGEKERSRRVGHCSGGGGVDSAKKGWWMGVEKAVS